MLKKFFLLLPLTIAVYSMYGKSVDEYDSLTLTRLNDAIATETNSIVNVLHKLPSEPLAANLLKTIDMSRFFAFIEDYLKIFPQMNGAECKQCTQNLDQYVEEHCQDGQGSSLMQVAEFMQQHYFSQYSVNEIATYTLLVSMIEDLTQLNKLISERAEQFA
jgi:hypothetical protein